MCIESGGEDRQEPRVAAVRSDRQAGRVGARAGRPQRVQVAVAGGDGRAGAPAGGGGGERGAAGPAQADARQAARRGQGGARGRVTHARQTHRRKPQPAGRPVRRALSCRRPARIKDTFCIRKRHNKDGLTQ